MVEFFSHLSCGKTHGFFVIFTFNELHDKQVSYSYSAVERVGFSLTKRNALFVR